MNKLKVVWDIEEGNKDICFRGTGLDIGQELRPRPQNVIRRKHTHLRIRKNKAFLLDGCADKQDSEYYPDSYGTAIVPGPDISGKGQDNNERGDCCST